MESVVPDVEEEDTTVHPLKMMKLKDYVTFMGTTCGLLAIFAAINWTYPWLACIFIFIATGFDLLDGAVARKFHQHNKIGGQLDSLSDVIVFSVAPGVLIYSQFFVYLHDTWDFIPLLACTIFFICSGVLRLAWFNINEKAEGYVGLVTPLAALFLVTYYLLDYFWAVVGWVPLIATFFHFAAPFFTLLIGIFETAPFLIYGKTVKKKQGIVRYAIVVAAGSGIAIIILGLVFFQVATVLTLGVILGAFGFLIAYVVVGFRNWLRANYFKPTQNPHTGQN